MIKKLMKALSGIHGGKGAGQGADKGADKIETVERSDTPPIIKTATSDGQTHLGQSTYSAVIDSEEYEWDIAPLYERAERGDFPLVRYEIPAKFLSEWYWGDSTVEEHTERTLHADFSYPILVWDGQVIDGTHRCCLALATGTTVIRAYNIINMPPYDRSYPAKASHRQPHAVPHGPTLTHKEVIEAVKRHIFTPLASFTTSHDDSPAMKAAIALALQNAEDENRRLIAQYLKAKP